MPRPKKKVVGKSKKKKTTKKTTKKRVIKKKTPVIIDAAEAENLRYIELINKIRKSEKQDDVEHAFVEILKTLKPRIMKIVSKFNIPGSNSDDIYQESLYALRYKAIKDYDKKRGSGEGLASFERFAVLCIRRHLATEFKSSFQNKKKVLNTSTSFSHESCGNDEDLSLVNILPSSDGNVLESFQKRENCKSFMTLLLSSLSSFEKTIFHYYANGESYEETAKRIMEKKKINVDDENYDEIMSKIIKSVDNALSRLKNKAKSLVEQNEEFKSLIPSRRRRVEDTNEEGVSDEV